MAYNELYSLGGGVITDDATATASQILSGYTAYVKGKKITGNIPSQGAQTITPGTSDKTIASGKYLSGTQTIKGDANLTAGNIKKGTSIFGVSGTYTSDANAGSGDILSGKIAYVNGSKVTGSMVNQSSSIRTITTDTGNQTLGAFRYYSNYIQIVPGKGYWGSWSWDTSRLQIAQSVLASAIGLTATKLANGQTVLGINGTYTGTVRTYYADVTSSSGSASFITDTGSSKSFPYIRLTTTSNITPYSVSCQQLNNGGLQCASDVWNFVINTSNITFFPKKTNGNFHWAKNDILVPVLNTNTNYRVCVIGI